MDGFIILSPPPIVKGFSARIPVLFRFESVLFPSKDTGTGDLLHVNNFYGDLTLYSDGETVQCGFPGQEPWTRDVMDIITLYPVCLLYTSDAADE